MSERKDFDAEYELLSDQPISENAVGAECLGVFYCRHRNTAGEVFAVKVFKRGSEETNQKARSQAALMKFIDHPNIICTRDWFDSERGIYLVMDLCVGGDLFDYISRRPAISERDVITIAHQILAGLQHCHYRGIVHHDLKPENILMLRPYPDLTVKITDFGFAQLMRTHDDMIQRWGGTESYWPPEIWRRTPHNEKSDMWSFGVILFVLLCGKPPFYCPQQRCQANRRCMCNALRDKVCRAEFQFYPKYFVGVSEVAKDLIRQLLQVNPMQRLSASQCLQHAWFASEGTDTPLPEWLESMRQFNVSRRDSQHNTAFALDSLLKTRPDVLAATGITDGGQADVLSEGGVQPLITLLAAATTSADQSSALNHLANYALNTKGSRELLDAGVVEQLVRLRKRSEDPDVSFFICLTLRRMMEDPHVRDAISVNTYVLEILAMCTHMRSSRASRAAADAVAIMCRGMRPVVFDPVHNIPTDGGQRIQVLSLFGTGCLISLLRSYLWEHQHDALGALSTLAEVRDTAPSLLDPAIALIPTVCNVVAHGTEGGSIAVTYVPTLHNSAVLIKRLAEQSPEGRMQLALGAVDCLARLASVNVDAVRNTAGHAIHALISDPNSLAAVQSTPVGAALVAACTQTHA